MAKEIALPLAPTKAVIKKALTAATKQKKNAEAAVEAADQTLEHLNSLMASLDGGEAPAKAPKGGKKTEKAPAKAKAGKAGEAKATVPELRKQAKALGINPRGMKRDELEQAIADAGKKGKKAGKKADKKAEKKTAAKPAKKAKANKKAANKKDESDDSDDFD